MKTTLLIILIFIYNESRAQGLKPKSISFAYFGETITHPGLKIGINYQLKSWDKTNKNGDKRLIQRSIDLSPSIGFFYHKNYQTGIFVLPELSYSRKKENGNFIIAGFGTGYMRSLIPNVYDLNSNDEIEKINVGYNYFISNYSITFGKDLSVKKNAPMNTYIKPQLMHALPNATNGILYFVLEIGASFNLTQSKTK